MVIKSNKIIQITSSFKAKLGQKFPGLLSKWYRAKLALRERSFKPESVTLIYSGNKLYADAGDSRGLGLLRNAGVGQPYIKNFWRSAIKAFKPEIVLDVGANYGEVFLDCKYPISVKKIIAVEASPQLNTYLLKSKKAHPNEENIIILNALAGEKNIEEVTFFIDKSSSGRSTALPTNFVQSSLEVTVPSYRLDDFVQKMDIPFSTIIFKIDVEGFESFVLNGMQSLFNADVNIIGCIEFNLKALTQNDIEVKNYLGFLNHQFTSVLLKKNGQLEPVKNLSESVLRTHFNNKHIEGDIILFTNSSDVEIFMNYYNHKN